MNNKYLLYGYVLVALLISVYIQAGARTIIEFVGTSLVTFLLFIGAYLSVRNIAANKLSVKILRIVGVISCIALIIVMWVYASFRQFNSFACKQDLIGKNILTQEIKSYCNFIPWYAQPTNLDSKFVWNTYTNSKYQYQIQYPKTWTINEVDPANVFFASPETVRYSNQGENIQNFDFSINVFKKRSPDPSNWHSEKIMMDGFSDGPEMITANGIMSEPEIFLIFRRDVNEYLISYPSNGITAHMVRSFVPGL